MSLSLCLSVRAQVTAATGRSSAPALNFYRELLRDGADKLSIDDINALMTLLNVQLTKKRAAAKPAAGACGGGVEGA